MKEVMTDQNCVIYRYFGQMEHQDSFLDEGKVYFNSLSYFLSCEDIRREDSTENVNIYNSLAGLQINNLTTRQTSVVQRSLISEIKNPDRVFVFCASLELSDDLFKKFNAYGCVEIFELTEFQKRIQKALNKKRQLGIVKNSTLLADKIYYYTREDSPGVRYACPDKIIMSKPEVPFSIEQEYRFAFAKDTHAFDVDNLDYSLAKDPPSYQGSHSHQCLTLGNLNDICKKVKLVSVK